MQSKRGVLDQAFMVFASILIGAIATILTESVFMLPFTSIVVFLLWDYSKQLKELRRRVIELEDEASKKEEPQKPPETK